MPISVLKAPVMAKGWERIRHSAMLYGILSTGVRVGANVMLLPLVLNRLSTSEQALWWIFLALGALASLADFGFGQAIARVYSFLWAGAEDFDTEGLGPCPERHEPNLPRIRELHASVQRLYLWIALLGMGVLILGGTPFLFRPAQSAANPMFVWLCWVAFVLAIGVSLATNYWILACQGINRVRELQKTYLWSGLSYVASAALFLVLGWGLFAMVAATALRAILGRELSRRAYLTVVPNDEAQPAKATPEILLRIWPNAWKFGVLSLGVYLVYNANVLICGHFLGPQVTASFGLTSQIGIFILNFSALWLAVKWPQITIMRTQGRLEEMGVLFARRLTLVMLTFLVLAGMLVLFGNRVLEWKGSQTRLLPTAYLLVYLLYLCQQQFYIQFGSLTYTENVVPFFKLSLFTGLALMTLSLVLVPRFALWGLVLAPLITTAGASSWYVVRRGFQGQPLKVRQFVRAAIYGHL
jgi:O-antigen/teichoic acid export membrane protein